MARLLSGEVRVLPSQRELEAGFSHRIPVAGARVAAGLAEHRHHVGAEVHGARLCSAGNECGEQQKR